MKKMMIYDPAMCCSTGVCGPGVDPELIRVSSVLNNLKKNGIVVERVNLTGNPEAFIANKIISDLLAEEGTKVLPVTLVDGEVVKKGAYPTNEEFCTLLEVPETHIKVTLTPFGGNSSGGCNCGGGEC